MDLSEFPPRQATELRLSELIGALSHALDLTEGQPPGHSLRSCWVGMHMAQRLGLQEEALSHVYYAILLKDAGCSSNAARLFQLYGSDDRKTKQDFKLVNTDSFLQLGKFVFIHTAIGKGLREKIQHILTLAKDGEELATELFATRCERGAEIACELGFAEAVADGIRYLDEHWDGNGKPYGLKGEQIPLASRLALMGQVVDVFYHADGPQAACRELERRAGSWFDPALVGLFHEVQQGAGFWTGLEENGLDERVAALEPRSYSIMIDDGRLDRIAEAFAKVVDAKSPYTYGHSSRVALYTDAVAEQLGLDSSRRRWLRRGALLHDIGKLGVSNAVLDKPGSLDEEEWRQVRMHAAYSRDILARIEMFRELAVIAGAHHERLDGKGYPEGLTAERIPLETRIITIADIYDAITAERPYRPAIPVAQALEMMEKLRGTALDPDCLDALKSLAPRLAAHAGDSIQ